VVGYLESACQLSALPDDHARWFADFAWNTGLAAVKDSAWADGAALFKSARILFQRCSGTPYLDLVRVQSAIAQAMLLEARHTASASSASHLRQRALEVVEQAQASLQSRRDLEQIDIVAANVEQMLARLAFEAMCNLKTDHADERWTAIVARAASNPRGAAVLAGMAIEAGDSERASQCLWAYLRLVGEDNCAAKVSAARRALVSMRRGSPREDGDEAARSCEEAVGIITEVAQTPGAALPAHLPRDEAVWLAITTWNAGADLVSTASRAEDEDIGKERQRLALRLLELVCQHEAPDSNLRETYQRLTSDRLLPPAQLWTEVLS